MKRTQMYKRVNSKKYNHINRNIVYPILYNTTTLNALKTTLEIKEIKTDESENENSDPYQSNNGWCDVSNVEALDENYVINRQARERRRLREQAMREISDDDCNQTFNSHNGDDYDRSEVMSSNRVNFFTIINKNIASDTSSENDIEVITFENTAFDNPSNSVSAYNENIEFGDKVNEKRTVWIYSMNNKKYLFEDNHYDFNISSQESSTYSTTTEDDDELVKDIRRIATPIPTYMPKLNLPSSPLPTLIEVAEPHKQSTSDVTKPCPHYTSPFHDTISSWFEKNTQKNDKNERDIDTKNPPKLSTLSQREKRRIRLAHINQQSQNESEHEQEVVINKEKNSSNIEEITKDGTTDTTNVTEPVIERTANNEVMSIENNNINILYKPQIKIDIVKDTKDISDPIEKLEGNWIGNGNDEIFEVYDYDLDTTSSGEHNKTQALEPNNAGDKLLIRNMSLLKPAEWAQYLPITGSVPSLHLSFETDYDEDKSWCKRIFKFINCCK